MAATTGAGGAGAVSYPSVTPVSASSEEEHDVVVVGAGLTGAMTALMMAQRGLSVTVYEKRADLREEFKREAAEKAGQSTECVLSAARAARALMPRR